MTRNTRRIIFFGFVLIFLIVTPGVLLYATGYSFDWESKQLIKTGSFYFQSQPAGAQIKIDGKLIDTTPSYVSRLNPGQYQIQISKDGFLTWQKKLNIEEQITTEARNIFIIPQKLNLELVTDNVTSTKDYFLTEDQRNVQMQTALIASSTLKDVLGFTLYQSDIYYLQKSNLILFKTDLSGRNKEQISLQPLPEPGKTDSGQQKIYQIVISPEQTAVFQPGGKFYLLDKQTKIFNLLVDEVQGIEFSSDNEKILFWTNHEIWVMWLKEIWAQPYRKAQDKELITRFADKITSALWLVKTNEHIIFAVQGNDNNSTIKLTELDGRDMRNTFDIHSGKISEVYYNQNDDLLYILTDGKLYSLDLLRS